MTDNIDRLSRLKKEMHHIEDVDKKISFFYASLTCIWVSYLCTKPLIPWPSFVLPCIIFAYILVGVYSVFMIWHIKKNLSEKFFDKSDMKHFAPILIATGFILGVYLGVYLYTKFSVV